MVRGGGEEQPLTCSLAFDPGGAGRLVQAAHAADPGPRAPLPTPWPPGVREPGPFAFARDRGRAGDHLDPVLRVDPTSLLLNIVEVHGRHQFRAHALVDFLFPLIVLQQKHASLLFLLAVGRLGRIARGRRRGAERRDRVWIVFLLAGLAGLPLLGNGLLWRRWQ